MVVSLRTRSSSRATSSISRITSPWMRCACSRMRVSFRTDWITWIDSISSDGETMTTRARGPSDQRLELFVDLGEDRFRRHEHEGRVLRLAGDQIFLRDRLDMHFDVAAELLLGNLLRVPAFPRRGWRSRLPAETFASITSDGVSLGMWITQSGRDCVRQRLPGTRRRPSAARPARSSPCAPGRTRRASACWRGCSAARPPGRPAR